MAARARRGTDGLIAGLAALAAAGCAAAPGPAATGAPPDARVEAPGGSLAASVWPAEGEARAVLLAVHGFGDYAETTWSGPAPDWAARGIEVIAYDQRGFGRNPSNRDWPGVEALVADLEAVAAEVAARRPDLPFFVAGHSMGGAVAVAAAGEGRLPEGTRLILLAPALWGGDSLGPFYRAGAWTMAQVIPDARFSRRDAPIRIRPSDNEDMLRAMSRDPLRFANPSGRELLGLIRLMDRAVAAAPEVRQEVLTVMGAHDEVVPEESVRAGHALLPGPKAFSYVDTGWHMLLRDLEAARVHALVADWILERAPARGSNGEDRPNGARADDARDPAAAPATEKALAR